MDSDKVNTQSPSSIKFIPHPVLCVMLSLASLLGALSAAFYGSLVFCVIELIMTATVIFFVTRDRIPMLGILLPAIGLIWLGADAYLSAIFVGCIFATAATSYLCLGRKTVYVPITATVCYAAAAAVVGPLKALPVLLPFALGCLISLFILRKSVTVTVGIGAGLLMAAFIVLIAVVCIRSSIGGISGLADGVREHIASALSSADNKYVIFDEKSAKSIAADAVNIAPAVIFVISYTAVYLCHALCISMLRASGLGETLPHRSVALELSPVTAVFIVIAFFAAMIFDFAGDGFALYSVTAYNIIIAAAPILAVIGLRTAAALFVRFVFRTNRRRDLISSFTVAALTFFVPLLMIPISIGIGTAYSLLPIYRYLFDKIKSHLQE